MLWSFAVHSSPLLMQTAAELLNRRPRRQEQVLKPFTAVRSILGKRGCGAGHPEHAEVFL
jgi:hypothetical protein